MFSKKKQFQITKENMDRITKEIDELTVMDNGIYSKVKEFELGYYIKIIIDREKLNIKIDEERKNEDIPVLITFLLIVDYSYPQNRPKILAYTKVIKHHFKFILVRIP